MQPGESRWVEAIADGGGHVSGYCIPPNVIGRVLHVPQALHNHICHPQLLD